MQFCLCISIRNKQYLFANIGQSRRDQTKIQPVGCGNASFDIAHKLLHLSDTAHTGLYR